MSKVSVERFIQQVVDGSEYKGHVKIGETVLQYELKFSVPIPRFGEKLPGSFSDARRKMQLTMRGGEQDEAIDLGDDEYHFFMQGLLTLAFDFYYQPTTREANQGRFGQVLHQKVPNAGIATISMTQNNTYQFPPELCAWLSVPKFGCKFAQ